MKIIHYSDDSLAESLSNNYTSCDVIKEKKHFLYLKEYLGPKGLGAKLILVEDNYISKDYLDDFALYYAFCFESYSKFCKRIHFFSEIATPNQLENALLDIDSDETLWENYLGFIVVKPIPITTIGTTLLKTYPNDIEFGKRFFWGIRKYQIHLFGKELTIESLAFQEQDSVVSACATSAIWSMLNKASLDKYTLLKSPSEITTDADSISADGSRLFPNKGLNILQISQSIRNAGLVSEIKQPDFSIKDLDGNSIGRVVSNEYLKKIINAYSQIGIPIILVISVPNGGTHGLHAITVSGYKKSAPKNVAHREEISYLSNNIEKLYAHDDQWGPFVRIPFVDECGLETPWTKFDKDRAKTFCTSIIVPVYPKIRISYEDIEVITLGLNLILTLFFANTSKTDLLWDIKIRYTDDFKVIIKKSSLHRSSKLALLQESLPKYLWVSTCYIGTVPIFDFTFDATDIKNGMIGKHIICYLPPEVSSVLNKFLITYKESFKGIFRHQASSEYYEYLIREVK